VACTTVVAFTIIKICVFHVCTAMFSVRQYHTKQLEIFCAMAYIYIRKTEERHRRKRVLWTKKVGPSDAQI
jgi:hypothetical protein